MHKFVAAAAALAGGAWAIADCDGNNCDDLEDVGLLQVKREETRVEPTADYPPQGKSRGVPYTGSRELGGPQGNGKIIVNVDGVDQELWLPGATTIANSTTVKYTPPWRFYLMKTDTTDYSNADNFYMPNLIGQTFAVDMYFGPDGPACGCNLNFYLVDMPAATPGKDGDYYCDAQCFPDLGCCYEFDMNEGNMEVQQITNHACTDDYAAHPDWQCHKWGDPEDKTTAQEFSPGRQHTINSKQIYTYEQDFLEDENGDAIVVTRMVQGDKVLTKKMGPGSDQLNAMFKVIKEGMVFVTGYWSDPAMNWLDGEECGSGPETCNNNPAYISNWKIYPIGTPSPAPPPMPPTAAPAPTPGPAPTPAGKGGCCYQSCDETSCDNDINKGWCAESKSNCELCGGGVWCK